MSKPAEQMLERLKNTPWLPPYEDEALKKVVDETNALLDVVDATTQRHDRAALGNPVVAAALVVNVTTILRNKRCALAYLNHRMNKIKDLYWETGEVPAACASRMAQHELEFYRGYQKLMAEYMAKTKLATDALVPPKQLYVSVRVVKEAESAPSTSAASAANGTAAASPVAAAPTSLHTDSGSLTLKRNTTHFLRRSDAELLIRQGVLQHVD